MCVYPKGVAIKSCNIDILLTIGEVSKSAFATVLKTDWAIKGLGVGTSLLRSAVQVGSFIEVGNSAIRLDSMRLVGTAGYGDSERRETGK